MKRLCLTMSLLAAVFSMGLRAQMLDARAKIPFDFWLGQTLMPAGAYSIYHHLNGAVFVWGEEGKRTGATFLPDAVFRADPRGEAKLEFTRYGSTYFLSRIWSVNQQEGYSIPKSSREKEIARHGVPSNTADIALSTK
jgi:hypothetical protein